MIIHGNYFLLLPGPFIVDCTLPHLFARRKTLLPLRQRKRKITLAITGVTLLQLTSWWRILARRPLGNTTASPNTGGQMADKDFLVSFFKSRKHKSTEREESERYHSPGWERVGEEMDEENNQELSSLTREREDRVVRPIRRSLATSPPKEMTVRNLHWGETQIQTQEPGLAREFPEGPGRSP